MSPSFVISLATLSLLLNLVGSSSGGSSEGNDTSVEEDLKSQEVRDDFQETFRLLKNATDRLTQDVAHLQLEQQRYEEDLNRKLQALENKFTSLEGAFNASQPRKLEGLENLPPSLHDHLSRLHQKYQEEIDRMRSHHVELNNTIATLHRNIGHITDLHDSTNRLRKIADLIVADRWHEAMLNWAFIESNLESHDIHTEAHNLLADHLRSVISNVCAGTGTPKERLHRLMNLFKFVQRVNQRQTSRSFAYETLVDQLLTDSDIFKGSEIFLLARFIRFQLGINMRANAVLPSLPNLLAGHPTVKLVYIHQASNGREQSSEKKNPRIPASLRNDTRLNMLELRIKGEGIKKKKDKFLSFKSPVNASEYRTYEPESSGSWNIMYNRESGHFTIKNAFNLGYLNVPKDAEYLRTTGSDDITANNIEFSFYLLDDYTVGMESANFSKPIIAVDCGEGSTCFKLKDSTGHSRFNWPGSRFTLVPVY